MSGPIVRKYGFPNFDKIFGKEEMKHGIDQAEAEAPVPDAKEGAPKGKDKEDVKEKKG